jgi:PAS domain S-box-containing protein
LQTAAEATARTIAIYTFACIMLALALGYLISNSISNPISKLRDAAAQIEKGEINVSFPRPGRDEVGQLVVSFSHMTNRLRQMLTELEQSIAERTNALRESEERYALAVEGANDGLWDWNLINNRIYFSPRWKAMLGINEDDISDSSDEWFNRVHSDDFHRVQAEVISHLDGHTTHLESEYRVLHKDGGYRWMLCRGLAVRDLAGQTYRMAGSQTDITARKNIEQQLMNDSLHDALTGLPNRVFLLDRLGHVLNRTKRRSDPTSAMLFLDIDRFKVINDSLGHKAGDELLIATARRLEY